MSLVKLQSEKETGNIEYKIRLCNDTEEKINQLGTQMLYRLYQGKGYVIYYLGVCDNGEIRGILENDLNNSFSLLKKVSNKIGAELINFIKTNIEGTDKFYMKVILKKNLDLSLIDFNEDEY
jgi:elongation factor 1-alpha|tara:strand:+ start:391 stop:756 length:366 start_codon:yes stop_codon:yes gene_type:complete